MTKIFSFVRRRPGLTHSEFLERWHEQAAATIKADPLSGVLTKFVLNEPITDAAIPGFPIADFDGMSEAWFDGPTEAREALGANRHALTGADDSIVDPAHTIVVAAEESVQFDHGWGEVKFVGLSKRGASFTHEEWCLYWVEVHGPLAYGVPEFARYYGRYVHNYVLPGGLGPIEPADRFDGIVEEWLNSVEDFVRCQEEPRYLEIIRPDEQRFVDITGSHFMIVRERSLLGSERENQSGEDGHGV